MALRFRISCSFLSTFSIWIARLTSPAVIVYIAGSLWTTRLTACAITVYLTKPRTYAALATSFSAFDIPLAEYESNKILGKTRSARGAIAMMTSLTLSSLALISTALVEAYPLIQMQLVLNVLTIFFIFTRYLRLFCIPGPRRLPRDYKPFDGDSSISDMGEGNESSSDGPLVALLLTQEKYYRQGQNFPPKTETNLSHHTRCVCISYLSDTMTPDINFSVKSDAGNNNNQPTDDTLLIIIRSRLRQIFLRKVI